MDECGGDGGGSGGGGVRTNIGGGLTRRQRLEFLLQPDFNWSRSLSERVRGMRDSALSIVWKKRREQKLRGERPYIEIR